MNQRDIALSEKQIAVRKILKYLVDHPFAMDTGEGIARWWLREDIGRIQPALTLLKNEEIIFTKRLNGNQYYLLSERYRRNPQDMFHIFQPRRAHLSKKARRKKYERTKDLNRR